MGAASGLLWPMCFLFKGPPLQEAGFEWSALLTLRPDVDSGLRRVGKVRGCPSPEVFTGFFGKHSRQVNYLGQLIPVPGVEGGVNVL